MSDSDSFAWRAEQISEIIRRKRENVSIEDLAWASGVPYERVLSVVCELLREGGHDDYNAAN